MIRRVVVIRDQMVKKDQVVKIDQMEKIDQKIVILIKTIKKSKSFEVCFLCKWIILYLNSFKITKVILKNILN